MPFRLIAIWCVVVLYLIWVQVTAAFSRPPLPAQDTVMPSMMAVLLGAGVSGLLCLRAMA